MGSEKGPFGYPEAFGWSLFALAGLLLGAYGLMAVRPEAAQDLISLGILSAAVYLLFSALLLGKYAPRPPARLTIGGQLAQPGEGQLFQLLGVRSTQPLLVPLGLVLGVVIQVPADSLRRLVERLAPLTEQQALERVAQLTPETPSQGVMLIAVAAWLVPIAEEVFFRGALYGALVRSGRKVWGAALATSVAFTLSHAEPRLWAPIGVVALSAGYLRMAGGSLLPCLGLHVGFNSVTVLGTATGLIRPYEDVRMPWAVGWGGWLLTAAVLVTFGWLAAGSERAAESRRRDRDDS